MSDRSRMDGDKYVHISTATTTNVKLGGSGVLKRVIINTTAAGTITINDTAGTIAVFKASVVEGSYEFGCMFAGKLDVITAAASDITVVYE